MMHFYNLKSSPHYHLITFSPNYMRARAVPVVESDIEAGQIIVDEDGYYHALGFGNSPEIAKENAYLAALDFGMLRLRKFRILRRVRIFLLGVYQVDSPAWAIEASAPYFPKKTPNYLRVSAIQVA